MFGLKAIITAGPTYEPIDPVRFIGNRSSGKQGYAIATTLAKAGIDVTLISGPTCLNTPPDIKIIRVETASQMLSACKESLPADLFIACAAVADWAPVYKAQKIKKSSGTPTIELQETPDILKTIAHHIPRPKLVIGFAAESENLIENALKKLNSKNADLILANDITQNIFGHDENHVYCVSKHATEEWPRMTKNQVAEHLLTKITEFFDHVS